MHASWTATTTVARASPPASSATGKTPRRRFRTPSCARSVRWTTTRIESDSLPGSRASYQCRTLLARTRRHDEVFLDVDPCELDLPAVGVQLGGPWPELDRALAKLPAAQREAVVLKYADDLTYEEMARITGVGESALKMRVQRAFARLRAVLQEVPSV